MTESKLINILPTLQPWPLFGLKTPRMTIATLIMDRSSSMKRFKTAPRDAMNDYLDKLKVCDVAAQIIVQIITFDREMQTVLPMQRVTLATDIGPIVPGHGTRLVATARDVMVPLMLDVLAAQKMGYKVNNIVALFTDGEDNCSTVKDLRELHMVTWQALQRGWELLTFGFGMNALDAARVIGFPTDREHARSMSADARSVHAAMSHTTDRTIQTATGPWIDPDFAPPSTPH